MIEVLKTLASARCRNCGGALTCTVGEWSPVSWHHDDNGRPECPGAPLADPDPDTVVALEEGALEEGSG